MFAAPEHPLQKKTETAARGSGGAAPDVATTGAPVQLASDSGAQPGSGAGSASIMSHWADGVQMLGTGGAEPVQRKDGGDSGEHVTRVVDIITGCLEDS